MTHALSRCDAKAWIRGQISAHGLQYPGQKAATEVAYLHPIAGIHKPWVQE